MPKRTDANQREIIAALRAAGATVAVLSNVGGGICDLLVGKNGRNYLLEIKNLKGRGNRLTPAEQIFLDTWQGQAAVVRSAEEAIQVISNAQNN